VQAAVVPVPVVEELEPAAEEREPVRAAEVGAAEFGRQSNQPETYRALAPTDLPTCAPGQVWNSKRKRCLHRHSGTLRDVEMTEYAYAL
jgi:hypothetical protein